MRIVNPRSFVLSFVLLAAACGGKSAPAAGGGGGGTGPTEPAPGPLAPGQWASMDHEAREDFMKQVVLPTMEAEFKAFDAERFADFSCKTCHGSGIDDHTYKMPHPDLPELSGAMLQNPPEEAKPMLEFMGGKVKPKMAELLGMPEWSPEQQDGFGCTACHIMNP
ncbi:MAG: hypothetical protein K8M05_13370 [Deltaproteobacteria bacterium]|nr:hypothetical protein [Kofleriaceae bacterium]